MDTTTNKLTQTTSGEVSPLARPFKDYCQVGVDLVWQRLLIYAAALLLAAFYYDHRLAIGILVLTAISEIYDFGVFRNVLNWDGHGEANAKKFLKQIYFGTLLSSMGISFYAIGIATLQGPTTHFMPLFFLFAAGLFAAMNNHQIKSVVVTRLLIYGITFLFIPIRDIVLTNAPLQSELWAQFFTSIFVMFFVIDSSRHYLQLYRTQLAQMNQLKEEHDKSEMAYKAKTEFVSTMSHELRTPLTSIKGAVDLLHSGVLGTLPDQATKTLSVAQRNCDRLLRLINEILDLQSVESGKMSFRNEKLDLVEATAQSIADNQHFASRLNVDIAFSEPAVPIWVQADRNRLQQVFSNVLSNAAKFSPTGSTVEVSMQVHNGHAEVLFRDEGVGLDEKDYDKVFDRFTQIDSTDTRQIGGTGLGMNVSKRIIEAIGGTIFYQRNEGKGTTFTVCLPHLSEPAE